MKKYQITLLWIAILICLLLVLFSCRKPIIEQTPVYTVWRLNRCYFQIKIINDGRNTYTIPIPNAYFQGVTETFIIVNPGNIQLGVTFSVVVISNYCRS